MDHADVRISMANTVVARIGNMNRSVGLICRDFDNMKAVMECLGRQMMKVHEEKIWDLLMQSFEIPWPTL